MRTALLAGATGLVGAHLLDRLLADAEVSRVVALVRRPLGRPGGKLEERVVDFDALPDDLAADDVYLSLGTTIKVAGSQARFRQVDHDYTVEVARRARAAGATRAALVSSVGASSASRTFYLRVKGDTERDVEALGFEKLVVARPSFILGERREKRSGESVGMAIAKALAFTMVGGLRRYRPIPAAAIAAALVDGVARLPAGTHALEYDRLSA